MHPFLVLLALLMTSMLSAIVVMRREKIPYLQSGWKTVLLIFGLPMWVFIMISFLTRYT